MPAKSKAQFRKMFVLEREGKVPKGTAKHWAHETKDYQALPEHVGKKAALNFNVPQLLAAIIGPDLSQSHARRPLSATLQQALEKVGQAIPDPSIFAVPTAGQAPFVRQACPETPAKQAAASGHSGRSQVLCAPALSFAQAARRLKNAGLNHTLLRELGAAVGEGRGEGKGAGVDTYGGEQDGFLLPSGLHVARRAKSSAVAAMGFGPTTPPAMLPVPTMQPQLAGGSMPSGTQGRMQLGAPPEQPPAPQGLTPGTPANLSGHAAISSTIQKKGPISATGDFSNPNAGQDVQKFAFDWRHHFGLSPRKPWQRPATPAPLTTGTPLKNKHLADVVRDYGSHSIQEPYREHTFDHLGFDDLDHIEAILDLEERTDRQIPDDDWWDPMGNTHSMGSPKFKNLGEFDDYLERPSEHTLPKPSSFAGSLAGN